MDKKQRKKLKKYLLLGVLAALVVLLALLPAIAKNNAAQDGPKESILRSQVVTGEIAFGIRGGGVLLEETPVTVAIPANVKLTAFLVSNADPVKAGQPIAKVDTVTAMAAIADTQEKLDLLARQINSYSAKQTSVTKLKAQAAGIVKIINGQPGQAVQDVLLEHGSLAVISLDGQMAAEVETDRQFQVGTKISVVWENGTVSEGKVATCLKGKLTVVLEDLGYETGTSVRLMTEDGQDIGSAVLQIRHPLCLMANEGIVDKVSVKQGQWVGAGDVILELSDGGLGNEYSLLLDQRRDLESLLNRLVTLHHTGVVTAQCDGVVTGILENCPALLDAAGIESDIPKELQPLAADPMAEVTVAAVIPQDTATVSIMVDQQDILEIKEGMEAVVVIPAFSDSPLTARVSAVIPEGINQGGSSKFKVELTLPRHEQMLSGMNAAVQIPLGSVKNTLVIPVAAVVDDGAKTYVYRGFDEKKDALTDPAEVVLGVSDGIYVEVLSGLAEGDPFYYAYYDTLEINDEPDFGVLPFAN